MALELQKAEMLRSAEVLQNLQSPTTGILRLQTDSGNSFFLVTKQILEKLSAELAKGATQLEETQ